MLQRQQPPLLPLLLLHLLHSPPPTSSSVDLLMLKNRRAVVALEGCKDVAHLICAATLPARTLLIEILIKQGESGQCAICKHFNYPPQPPPSRKQGATRWDLMKPRKIYRLENKSRTGKRGASGRFFPGSKVSADGRVRVMHLEGFALLANRKNNNNKNNTTDHHHHSCISHFSTE